MMKKLLATALAALLVLSLVACGGDDAQESGGSNTLTVGIWGGNDQESAAIEQVKADFEAKFNCTVELKVYTDYNTQIQADFIGGTAPDVFYIDGNVFPFYSTLGVMEPLDPAEMETDKYYENLIDAFTAEDGTIYCIPKDVSTLAVYYNIDLLESVGYTPEDMPSAPRTPWATPLPSPLSWPPSSWWYPSSRKSSTNPRACIKEVPV